MRKESCEAQLEVGQKLAEAAFPRMCSVSMPPDVFSFSVAMSANAESGKPADTKIESVTKDNADDVVEEVAQQVHNIHRPHGSDRRGRGEP